MSKRLPLNHSIDGNVVTVYKQYKGKTCEILMDKDVFEEIEKNQYSVEFTGRDYVKVSKWKKRKRIFRALLHRFAMGMGPSYPGSNDTVDHIDRNKLNNLRTNLRKATQFEQQINLGPQKNNSIGIRGVYFDKSKNHYIGAVRCKGKRYTTGCYTSAEEASNALTILRNQIYKEFAIYGN